MAPSVPAALRLARTAHMGHGHVVVTAEGGSILPPAAKRVDERHLLFQHGPTTNRARLTVVLDGDEELHLEAWFDGRLDSHVAEIIAQADRHSLACRTGFASLDEACDWLTARLNRLARQASADGATMVTYKRLPALVAAQPQYDRDLGAPVLSPTFYDPTADVIRRIDGTALVGFYDGRVEHPLVLDVGRSGLRLATCSVSGARDLDEGRRKRRMAWQVGQHLIDQHAKARDQRPLEVALFAPDMSTAVAA